MRTRGVRRRAGAPSECENGGKSGQKSEKRSQRASKRMPAERFFEKAKRRAMSIFGFGSGSQLGAMSGSKNEAKRARNRKKKNVIFVVFLKVCKMNADSETILVRFSARADRQK